MIKLNKPVNSIKVIKKRINNFLYPIEYDFNVEYIKKKTAEECCELATALMQNINKKKAFNDQQIENEIADVLMWITELAKHYDLDYIGARVEKKKNNYFKDEKVHYNYLRSR